MQKTLVNIQSTLVTDDQSSELAQPSQRTFYNPRVLAQFLVGLYSPSGNPRSDASLVQSLSATLEVVPLVRMQLVRPFPSSSADVPRLLDRLDSIHYIRKSITIVNIGSSADYRERNSFGVNHPMALRARFSFIRRIGAGTFSPFLAATLAESTAARDQSILPASPSLSR
jgi:hypothetical protein